MDLHLIIFFSFVKLIMVEWSSKDGLVNIQIKFPLLLLLLPLLVDFTKKIAPLSKMYKYTKTKMNHISLNFFFHFLYSWPCYSFLFTPVEKSLITHLAKPTLFNPFQKLSNFSSFFNCSKKWLNCLPKEQ